MSYPVIVVPYLNVDGMAVFPFILVKSRHLKNNAALIRHETIHMQQAFELLVLPFYILYLLNYLINRLKYHSHNKAYMEIIFEREAYQNERNANYLTTRRLWAWRFYLK